MTTSDFSAEGVFFYWIPSLSKSLGKTCYFVIARHIE